MHEALWRSPAQKRSWRSIPQSKDADASAHGVHVFFSGLYARIRVVGYEYTSVKERDRATGIECYESHAFVCCGRMVWIVLLNRITQDNRLRGVVVS